MFVTFAAVVSQHSLNGKYCDTLPSYAGRVLDTASRWIYEQSNKLIRLL